MSSTWKVLGTIKGPPGEGATYEHTQTAAAAQWTVSHRLSTFTEPLVLLDDDPGRPAYTDFEYLDENTILIYFPEPVTGRAFVSN